MWAPGRLIALNVCNDKKCAWPLGTVATLPVGRSLNGPKAESEREHGVFGLTLSPLKEVAYVTLLVTHAGMSHNKNYSFLV